MIPLGIVAIVGTIKSAGWQSGKFILNGRDLLRKILIMR